MSGNGKWVRVVDPATGESKAVAPDVAEAGFRQGQLQLPSGTDVDLVADDGTVGTFAADKVQKALEGGLRFANRGEVAKVDAQGHQVQAGVEAGLSALTFGLSDVALKQSGVDATELAARRDTTGGSVGTGLGLGASLIGPGILGKVVGGVGKAAFGAALAPTLAINAAGEAIEQAAARGLGTILSNEAARGAVAAGLGRATEGAVIGMGGVLSESALGDADVNAEHMLAGAGLGALIGAVPGAAVGGLRGFFGGKAAVRAALPEDATVFASGARAAGLDIPDEAAKKWWPSIRDLATKGAKLGGYDPEKAAMLHTPQARKVLRDLDGALETNARDFHGALDALAENQTASRKAVFGELAPAALDKVLPRGSEAAVLSRVGDDFGQVRGILKGVEQDWAELGFRGPDSAKGAVRGFEKQLDNLEDKLFKHMGELSTELDQAVVARKGLVPEAMVRRPLSAAVDAAGEIPHAAIRDAFVGIDRITKRLADAGRGVDEFNDVIGNRFASARDVLRSNVEDAAVWGQAGEQQAKLGRAFQAREAAFDRLHKVGLANAEGEITAASVQRYVNAMDRVRGDDAVEALAAWRTADAEWSETAHTFFPNSGLLQRAAVVHGRLGKVVDGLEENVGINSALRSLRARKEMAYGLEASGGMGALGGAVLGGPVGAVLGYGAAKVGQAILDPARFGVVASNAAYQAERMGSWLEGRAATLAGLKGRLGPPIPAGRVISRATDAMLQGSDRDRQAAFEERIGELQQASDPRQSASRMTHALGDLPDHLPDHTAAIARTAAYASSVLSTHIPKPQAGTAGTGVDAMHGQPRPSHRDLLRFAQIDRAVQDPASVIERAAAGKPVYEHELKAIDQVYPKMMQGFRQRLLTQIASADKPPSGQLRRNASMILGQVPSISVLKARQMVHQQAPQPQGRPHSAPTSGGPTAMAGASQGTLNDTYPALPR